MTDLMTKILDSLPGYREAEQHLAAIKALPQIPDPPACSLPGAQWMPKGLPHLAVAEEVVQRAEAGTLAKVDGTSLVKVAADAAANHAAAVAAREGLKFALEHYKTQLDEIRRSNEDLILDALDNELQTIQTRLRDLTPLAPLTSARAALDADRVDDMREFEQLATTYSLIRREQWKITRTDDLAYPEAAVIRNIRKVFPHWAPWRAHGHLVHRRGSQIKVIAPPWVDVPDTREGQQLGSFKNTIPADTATVAFLVWAIESDADLWVPTDAKIRPVLRDLVTALMDKPARAGALRRDPDWEDPGAVNVQEAADLGETTGEKRSLVAERRRDVAMSSKLAAQLMTEA